MYPLLSAISLLRPVRTVIEIHGWRAAPLYPPLHDHQLASGSNANTKTCKSQNTNHRQICTWEEKCMKTQIKAMKIELYAFLTEQIKRYKVSQKRTNKNGQTWQVCQNNCIKSMKNFFPTSIFPLYMELPKQSVLVGFRRRGLNNCWHFQLKLAARALPSIGGCSSKALHCCTIHINCN